MLCNKNECTGCFACYNICPKNCIDMIEDDMGNILPRINEKLCINCKMCTRVCPELNKVNLSFPKKCYAAWSIDENERKTSSSGGVSSILANYIVNMGGVVFGCTFENGEFKHIRITNKEDLYKIKGSKYVHSYVKDTYRQAKRDLENNKKVIYTGTPCQISGLKKYLNKDYVNLITIDIICHGVPPQKFLKENIYKYTIAKKYDNIVFRYDNKYSIKVLDGKEIIYSKLAKYDFYYRGFLESLFCRESCYKCTYACNKRCSDITLGDFWGLGKNKKFNGNKTNGVSVVLVNTSKGEEILSICRKNMFIEERDIEEAISGNSQLREPSLKHKKYDKFKNLYIKKNDFNKSAKVCLKNEILKDKFKDFIRNLIK